MDVIVFIFFIFISVSNEEVLIKNRRSCTEAVAHIEVGHFYFPSFDSVENPVFSKGIWTDDVKSECGIQGFREGQEYKTKFFGEQCVNMVREHLKYQLTNNYLKEKLLKIDKTNGNIDELARALHEPTKHIFDIKHDFDNDNMKLTIYELGKQVSKCGDIGESVDNKYEFYEILPYFMIEQNGQWNQINEDLCEKRLSLTDIPEDVLYCNNESVLAITECSINSINKCSRHTVFIADSHSSYVRQLPDGVVLFGKFEILKHRNTTLKHSRKYMHYYLSYSVKADEQMLEN